MCPPGQFRDPAFVGRVEEILQEAEIDAQRLTLEMTETYFIQNPARARQTLEMLRGMESGLLWMISVPVSPASVYLRQFGFDRVKIDKSLVQDITESQRSAELLHATVALARSLDMPVTRKVWKPVSRRMRCALQAVRTASGLSLRKAKPR